MHNKLIQMWWEKALGKPTARAPTLEFSNGQG